MRFNIKVPFFRQEVWYTCGPACMRMILAFLGIIKTEEEITEVCDTTELGTTPTQISQAFEILGIKASSVKNTNIEELKNEIKEGRPVIALIDPSSINGGISGFGHFIVIVGIKDEEIEYHDPDEPEGKNLKCDFEAFIRAWNASRCWMIKIEKE
ncbi:MAG: C39 family peptidase [Candidatus Methanoperedens sp.]|nr:C39 family peptidase [Candidatus Methanoperedens sp.]